MCYPLTHKKSVAMFNLLMTNVESYFLKIHMTLAYFVSLRI